MCKELPTEILYSDKYLFIEKDNKTNTIYFHFDTDFWTHFTNNILEASAILSISKYSENDKIRRIELIKREFSEKEIEDTLYWLSGGNARWLFNAPKFGFESAKIDLLQLYKKSVISSYENSKNIGDLIDRFKDIISAIKYYLLENDLI